MTVNISGLDKASVLAALYNSSQPQGMGFLHYDSKSMTVEEAEELLTKQRYFDYLNGRLMKIEIPENSDELAPWGYDRDLGKGAVARVIAELRSSEDVNSEVTQAAHKSSLNKMIEKTEGELDTPTNFSREGVTLGLDDVADELREAMAKFKEEGLLDD